MLMSRHSEDHGRVRTGDLLWKVLVILFLQLFAGASTVYGEWRHGNGSLDGDTEPLPTCATVGSGSRMCILVDQEWEVCFDRSAAFDRCDTLARQFYRLCQTRGVHCGTVKVDCDHDRRGIEVFPAADSHGNPELCALVPGEAKLVGCWHGSGSLAPEELPPYVTAAVCSRTSEKNAAGFEGDLACDSGLWVDTRQYAINCSKTEAGLNGCLQCCDALSRDCGGFSERPDSSSVLKECKRTCLDEDASRKH